MTDSSPRLKTRVHRDFAEPETARSVLRLLAELPGEAGYDPEILASERIQAAIVLFANGDLHRLRQALDLARADWRDLLVAAELADEDWPLRLNSELGRQAHWARSQAFQTLGLAPAYSCQVNPEFPGKGDWNGPVHCFYRDGTRSAEPFPSQRGTPAIVRFTLADASTWIGMFEEGSEGLNTAFACPSPLAALVVSSGQAYLIDVTAPSHTTPIRPEPITQASAAGKNMIVLASLSQLTAIGPHGQVWVSEWLCQDDLEIATASADTIECTCDFVEGTEHFKIDARTGRPVEKRDLPRTRRS